MKSKWVAVVVILAALAAAVPIQYLVRKEVVVGLASEHAHSHAHGEEDEHAEQAHAEDEHTHPEEEGHPAAEIPLNTNLISNYSFEVGTRERIWGWGKRGEELGALVYRDENRSYKGFASAAVSSQGSGFVDAGWFMQLGVLPIDHDLVFRGYVRTEELRGEAYLGIVIRGATQEEEERKTLLLAYTDDLEGTGDWTLTELRCHVPPEATEIWLDCGMYGTGRAWFDEISLVVEEREAYPPQEVNLLRNPSFEERVRHWHIFMTGTSHPPAYATLPVGPGGGNALRVSNPPESDPSAHTGFYQTMCGFRGKTGALRLSGMVRGESLMGRAWIDVIAFRASGSLGFMVTRELTGNTGWESFEIQVPLDGEATSLMVRINVEGGGTLYVDDLGAFFTENISPK